MDEPEEQPKAVEAKTVSPELLNLLRASKQAADIAQIEFHGIAKHVAGLYGFQRAYVDLATGVITPNQPEEEAQ